MTTDSPADGAHLCSNVTLLDVRQALAKHYRPFHALPNFAQMLIVTALRMLTKESRINRFLAENAHLNGFDFIEQVFEELKFSYDVCQSDLNNIPADGPLIIVANHPLGGLDGLSLLHLIGKVRRDVKIVANHLLKQITPLSDLFLAVDNIAGESRKKDIRLIEKALRNRQAVIFFPSGAVSRATSRGIRDKIWNTGFLRFAERFQSPILPIQISARNSALFYLLSWVSAGFSLLCLPREMIGFSGLVKFSIGPKIDSNQLEKIPLSRIGKVKLIQRHVYRLSKNKSPLIMSQQK